MSLDIVIPAHNEEQRIDRTLRAYRTGFPQADVRFLVALDGCDDHTSDVVRAHAAADERVVLHEFPKLGKGGVLMETFRRSDADLVALRRRRLRHAAGRAGPHDACSPATPTA